MRFVPLICFALLGACAAKQQVQVPWREPVRLGDEFTLKLGETVVVDGKNLSIRFSKVIEEGRCPMNARCVWEGNAKIALHVIQFSAVTVGHEVPSKPESTVELNTSERFDTRQRVSDLTIELRHLEPTPMAGAQTEGYVATLLVGQSQ